MIEFGLGTATGALIGWLARARLHPAPAPDAPATDRQRAYLKKLMEELAGAQQLGTEPLPDPWDATLSTQRASAVLDRLTPRTKCVERDRRRGIVHVKENCPLHGTARPDVALDGEGIVFSGFRDATVAKQINSAGGTVEESLTKSRTTRLLVWNVNGTATTKSNAAKRYGIPIEGRADFVRRFYQESG